VRLDVSKTGQGYLIALAEFFVFSCFIENSPVKNYLLLI